MPGATVGLTPTSPQGGETDLEVRPQSKASEWKLGGRGTRNNIISTPVLYEDKVLLSVGQDPEHGEGPGHLFSIDATQTGEITEKGRIWHVGGDDFRRSMSTVAIQDGLLYAADLTGFLYCLISPPENGTGGTTCWLRSGGHPI